MPTTREIIAAKKKELKEKSGGFFRAEKIQPGKSFYVFLPPSDGEEGFWHDHATHFIKSGGSTTASICMDKTFGESCPICEAVAQVKNMDGMTKEALDVMDKAYATQRYIVNAVKRNLVKRDGKAVFEDELVQLELPKTVFEDYLALVESYLEEVDKDITEWDELITVSISKEGSGMDTKYSLQEAKKQVPLDTDKFKSELPKLAELVETDRNDTRVNKAVVAVLGAAGIDTSKAQAALAGGSSSAGSIGHDASIDDADFEDVDLEHEVGNMAEGGKDADDDLGDLDLDDLTADL